MSVLHEAYAQASQRTAVVEERLLFAGRPASLCIAGRALAQATLGAFGHLRGGDERDPELTIELWDESATGIPLPFEEPAAPRVSVDRGGIRHEGRGSVTELRRIERRITGWRARAGSLSPEERMKPLPVVLPLFLLERGVSPVHGGLVAVDGRGALLAGAAGAGKTTAALACAASGFSFLADDSFGLEEADGAFTGHSLYASAWLAEDHLRRHPHLRCGRTSHRTAGKTILFPGTAPRVSVARSSPIRVIVLPTGGRGTGDGLRPAAEHDAFRALAPMSVVGVSSIAASWILERLAGLVRALPAFWLDAGADPSAIPALVAEALRTARL